MWTPGSHTTAAMASTRAITAKGPADLSSRRALVRSTGLHGAVQLNVHFWASVFQALFQHVQGFAIASTL